MKATMMLLVGACAAVLALAPAAAAAPLLTKDQAYKIARACLLQHDARFVGRRGDGGGFVFFKGVPHVQYWTYKTRLRQVRSVTYYAVDLPDTQKKAFIACVKKGI
jgi:hypothetical protein